MNKKISLNKVPKIKDIQDMIMNTSDKYTDKLALEDLQDYPIAKATYSQLKEYILKFGDALKNLELKERTHVALIGENRVQWGISYLTLMSFNYVVVPIDKNLTPHEIMNIIHESDAEVIIFSDSYSEFILENKHTLKKLKTFICMDKGSKEEDIYSMKELIDSIESTDKTVLPKIDSGAMAGIIFTSGSLGRAKGVMLSQENLASNLMDMLSMLMMYPKDRFLSVLPIHHTYECTCGLLCPLFAGSSIHYSRSLKTVADDMKKVKATIVLGVPLLFDKMFSKIMKAINEDKLKSILVPKLVSLTNVVQKLGVKNLKAKIFKELQDKFGGSIRLFIVGGAAADPVVAEGLQGFGFGFIQGYGLTETSPILALNQLENFKNDAAGIPLPHVQLKIVNPDEKGIGEIYAKGKNVMIGYYNNEQQTKDTFDNTWFKTGDLGCFDEDSFLHIMGRKKNVIISKSGKNVFPEEIEDLLNRSPYIMESLVYGKEDEKHDEIIAAQIVVDAESFILLSQKNERSINEIFINEIISKEVEKVNNKLPIYKRIIKFDIREEEFEKTTTKKIKRYVVQAPRE